MRSAIATLALCCALSVGCKKNAESGAGAACGPKGEVAIALVNLPNTLDWSRSSAESWPNYPVMHAMMRGLTTLDEKGLPIPDLAESWDVSLTADKPARQVYLFHLRKGVVWSDGKTPLTAQDFVFGWRRALAGNSFAELSDLQGFAAVEAAQAKKPRDEAALKKAIESAGVEAIDSSTLKVTLSSPRAYFVSRVALVYPFFPAPSADLAGKSEEEIQRYFDEPANGKPLTLGAFRVVSWDRLAGVKLAAASGSSSGITQLTLVKQESKLQYEKCVVPFYAVDDAALLRSAPPELQRQPLMSTYWLGIKVTSPLMSLGLRRAIAHAIDRKATLSGLLPEARPAFGLMPSEVPGSVAPGDPLAKDYPTFDLEAAKKELASSGYKGEPLKLLVGSSSSFMPEIGVAESIRRQLEVIGIKVQVVTTADFGSDIKLRDPSGAPHYQMYLKRIGADFAHPESFLSMWSPGNNNYTGWEELEGGKPAAHFVDLLARGAAETDPAKMKPIYSEAERMLLHDYAVIVPLYHPDRYFLRRPWLSGLTFSPFNFLSFRSMRVEMASK